MTCSRRRKAGDIVQTNLYAELDTPSLLIDLDIMEQNLQRGAALARQNGVKLRPHIKTHKSSWIARRQLDYGAQGITAAKLSEAEVMHEGGIEDILLAYPVIGQKKIDRLASLLKKTNIKIAIDSVDAADAAAEAARRSGVTVQVYLDVDTGLGRMGLPSGQPTVDLAREISRRPGVEIVGLLNHSGHLMRSASEEELEQATIRSAEKLVKTADMMRAIGIDVKEVSPGFTAGARFEATVPGVTEIRPGTYVLNDANSVYAWAAKVKDCAAFVLTQVVSRPARDRAVIDAGSKTLTQDRSVRSGHGIILGHPDVIVHSLSEEHGVLAVPPESPLAVGDRLLIVPNHICPVVNLFDVAYGVRNGAVEMEIPVEARGQRQ